jgi:hypothetical protein
MRNNSAIGWRLPPLGPVKGGKGLKHHKMIVDLACPGPVHIYQMAPNSCSRHIRTKFGARALKGDVVQV